MYLPLALQAFFELLGVPLAGVNSKIACVRLADLFSRAQAGRAVVGQSGQLFSLQCLEGVSLFAGTLFWGFFLWETKWKPKSILGLRKTLSRPKGAGGFSRILSRAKDLLEEKGALSPVGSRAAVVQLHSFGALAER